MVAIGSVVSSVPATRRITPLTLVVALIALLALGVPDASAKSLLDTRVGASKAVKRSCFAAPVTGRGVVARHVRTPSVGVVQVRLYAPRGDWDLGVFDTKTGRTVAGSAFFRAREVAQGYVAKGRRLRVQACRRSGKSARARLKIDFTAIKVPKQSARSQLVSVSTPTKRVARRLVGLGLDMTDHGKGHSQAVVLHGAADTRALRTAGLSYKVLIRDMAARDRADRRADARYERTVSTSALPSGRTTYRRLMDYGSEMRALATANPTLVKTLTLPFRTWEGRPVEGIEITTNPNERDGKPVFVQLGVHHAREWPSGEHALEWAYELVNGYRAGNARVRNLVENTRTIVIPVVNPDGFNASREAGELQGGGGGRGGADETVNIVAHPNEYRRKNCRLVDDSEAGNCNQPALGLASPGVDPNRNYGAFWGGPGTSADQTNETYHGPAPFSEPETKNIRALVSARQVTTLITNHTFSNLVLRPPGVASQGPSPDEPLFKALGDSMAAENGYASQFGFQLYDTTGTTEDWSYYATGGLGFTFEIGPTNFHPPYADVVAEYEGTTAAAGPGAGNREAYFKALENTADVYKHSFLIGRAPPGAILRVRKFFDTPTSRRNPDGSFVTVPDALNNSIVVPPSGIFRWHINPSTRPLVAQARGRAATGPPSPTVNFSGVPSPLDARPCADSETPDPACFNDHAFTVPSGPAVDNAKATIRIEWATVASDWDMKVFRDANNDGSSVGETNLVGSSAQGTTDFEQASLTQAQLTPGRYVIRVTNFAATEPYTGTVDFEGPDPVSPARTEPWIFTCESPEGQVRQATLFTIKRGERQVLGLDGTCGTSVFGRTTATSSFSSMSTNTKRATRFGLTQAARITKLRAYLDGRGATTGSQAVKGVVYTDAGGEPAALAASSAAVTIQAGKAPGWVDLTFATPFSLGPGNYWLGLHSGTDHAVARYAWGTRTNARRYNIDTYTDGPSNPFGGGRFTDNQEISIFAYGLAD